MTAPAAAVVHELVELSQEVVRAVQEHDVVRLGSLPGEEFTLLGVAWLRRAVAGRSCGAT